jgi:hypothetical protein
MSHWNARRILKELVDGERRRAVLADFWRFADPTTRAAATAFLAKAFHSREQSIRKMTPERKAELLGARSGAPEAETFLEAALMQHHIHGAGPLMKAFLDHWGIPNVDGQIEEEQVTPPDTARVREALAAVGPSFDAVDVRLYLASVGLLMGDEWAAATWPVVDELA